MIENNALIATTIGLIAHFWIFGIIVLFAYNEMRYGSGVFDRYDNLRFIIILWPLYLVASIVIKLIKMPESVGRFIGRKIRNFNREKNDV